MAKHDVTFEVPKRPPGRADISFRVKRGASLLGTLAGSNGSIVWFPKGKTYGCKMGWQKLDRILQEHATRVEKR